MSNNITITLTLFQVNVLILASKYTMWRGSKREFQALERVEKKLNKVLGVKK